MISGLYAITNEALMPGEALYHKTEAALIGGCRLVQYRNKTATSATKIIEARRLKNLCDQYTAQLIINDSVELMIEVNAAGVHLGQTDGSIAAARAQLNSAGLDHGTMIGATCHSNLALAKKAIREGASYVAFGRFFSSQTKPDAQAASLSLLSEARQAFAVPIVAIGGINRHNIQQIIDHRVACVAVSHDLFAQENLHAITKLAQHYQSLLFQP